MQLSVPSGARRAALAPALLLALAAATLLPAVPLAAQAPRSPLPLLPPHASPFTLAQIEAAPFPLELVASPAGDRVAWVFNERGVRNVYVADGPGWQARRLTPYTADDGQELTNLAFSSDGRTVVYVRGGDHDSNWPAEGNLAPDPASSPEQPKVQIWAVSAEPVAGAAPAAPRLLADGDQPVVSKRGVVAFLKDRAVWTVPVDGSAPAKRLFFARGDSRSPVWSPDGARLAFVTDRGDHAFVAVYADSTTPLLYLAPSTSRDFMPRWSPDGSRIAFVRTAGSGGAPDSILVLHPQPWSIWVADSRTGEGRQVWASPVTLRGSVPRTDGGANLDWGAGDRLVFLADLDGWPHLYSLPAAGGEPTLLTPARGMAEYISLSPDRRFLVFAGNMGTAKDDIDRRHIFRVAVDRPGATDLTPGDGVEWTPVVTSDNRSIAFIAAGAKASPLPAVMPVAGGAHVAIGAERVPADFPVAGMVVPRAVVFHASDGTEVHGQLFEAAGRAGRKPAVVFVHGGPPRQMLLGWHPMDYYSNSYAVNQYLASKGYVVLSVNYRLGIGYGHEFHHPAHAGPQGASEYLDVQAGGEYLRALPQVDPARIGIWGGSYGGFLTAMALAKNSDVFAAGVDLHGVHDWTAERARGILGEDPIHAAPDAKAAFDTAWASSPDAHIATWKSPVLLIQGDDDRNVRFHQTVDLARRLEEAGVPHEVMVIPDEIHGFLRHASWLEADSATAAFFDREFGGMKAAPR